MSDITVNLLGGSRRTKDDNKGLYRLTYDTIVAGSGIQLELRDLSTTEEFMSDPNLVPWASKPLKELVISASADYDVAVMAPLALSLARSVTSDLEDYVDDVIETTVSGMVAGGVLSAHDYTDSQILVAEDYTDDQIAATVSGYSGPIVISGSVTLTVLNGLITTFA